MRYVALALYFVLSAPSRSMKASAASVVLNAPETPVVM